MLTVQQTSAFVKWLNSVRDKTARARIVARLERLPDGNFGDCKSVGGGVLELRMDFGPGYRVYCMRDGDQLVLLLLGGDKSTQVADIAAAIQMAIELRA